MRLSLVTPPAVEPISVAEAKEHLRVDDAASDSLISAYIVAARRLTEESYGLALVTQAWDLHLDRFPYAGPGNPRGSILVPRPPLQSVGSVTYVDTDGSNTTLDAADYRVQPSGSAMPGRIVPAIGRSWPGTADVPGAVTVRFTAGFGDSAVPEEIRLALKFLVAHWFENREIVPPGGRADLLPFAYEALLAPHQVWGF